MQVQHLASRDYHDSMLSKHDKRRQATLRLLEGFCSTRRFVHRNLPQLDLRAWLMHDLCMPTKTISIETDAYELLLREKRERNESFSRVIRRLFAERHALTAGELLEAMRAFEGKGAGPRRKRSRHAAA